MNKEETARFEELKNEVSSLRKEVDSLREFVKALYSMMDDGEQDEGGELPAGVDFGRINT